MASISLRSYNKEIEHLIDQGQIDEAIGHCMHILQSVPKHLGTYRLLGKALLESKRYSDATDIFQRVLSSVPDDFVANVGMSIIRENEKNLDTAIWHMERAFESQPANTVVQDELRRLYGRRDGIEPPKIRLTRGALARMYVRGHLYRQAIGELRAALVEDPQRPDLQVLLAEMYYQNGQKVEAVDTCSNLLKKYPFCLEANRILTNILPETERKDDAVIYLQRVISLDPYYGKLSEGQTSSDQVPDQAITLEKLSYQTGQNLLQSTSQPDWVTSLGAAFEPAKVTDALPDWLTAPEEGGAKAIEETGPAPVGEAVSEQPPSENQEASLPDWFSDGETPIVTDEAVSEENIPEFLKDAGWGPSSGEFDEEAMSRELQADETTAEAIEKSELPDWLQQMAPPEVKEEGPIDIETAGDVPPWLQESTPGSTDTIISWLKAIPQEEAGRAEEPQAESESPEEAAGESFSPAEDIELPSWLSEQNQNPTGVTGMLPSWLPESDTPVVADSDAAMTSEPIAEIPDWLQGIENEIKVSSPQVEAEPTEVAPIEPVEESADKDWLADLERPALPSDEIQRAEPVRDELTEWLQSLESTPGLEETSTDEPPMTWEAAIAEVTKMEEEPSEAFPAEEMLDWTTPVDHEPELLAAEDVIEPLKSDEMSKETLAEAYSESEATPAEESVSAEIPAWLKDLETLKPEEESRLEESGAWLDETATEEREPTPEIALPDWLSEIETAAVSAEETTPVVPDMLEDTKPRVIKLPTELAPEAEVPSGTAPAEAVFNLEDPDAAMAWLESLAAQQGVPQDQLTSSPEERPLTPDWLEQAGQEAEEKGELSTYVPTETTQLTQTDEELLTPLAEQPTLLAPIKTTIPHEPEPEPRQVENIPDWLIGIETAAVPAEEALPAQTEDIAEALEQPDGEEISEVFVEPVMEEEFPGWTEEIEISQPAPEAEFESQVQPAQVVPEIESAFNLEDPDAALAWLESLAAQQGIPQDQLTTAPEERPSTPEWLEHAGLEAEARGELSTYVPTETTQIFQPPVETYETVAEELVIEEPVQIPATEAEEAVEMPDWLNAIEPGEPVHEIPLEEIPELAPDWLQEFEATAEPHEVTQPAQVTAEEPTDEEELPSWLREEVEDEEFQVSIPEAPTWISEDEPVESIPEIVEPDLPAELEETPAYLEPQQKLDLNAASLRELENLPGMGFILAQSITAYRETSGPFTEVEELLAVPGIDEPMLDQIKDYLEVKLAQKKPSIEVEIVEAKSEDEKQLMEAKRLLAGKDYDSGVDHLQGLVRRRLFLPEIIHDLQEVMNVEPGNIYLWQALGDAFMRNDQLQEALDAYSKAEQLLR